MWNWRLHKALRDPWVHAAAYAVFAVLTVAAAEVVAPFLPEGLDASIGADAVDDVLGILATSMLAVTTFSLSVAVSALAAAANNATPRATELLQQDRTTQNVLATFLGAFLFGLVGTIALHAGLYSSNGRLVLYVATVGVVIGVVVALLRWISHLMRFGRMRDTLDRVEQAARHALEERIDQPYFGGHPMHGAAPKDARPLLADTIGYVQHVEVASLSRVADELEARVFMHALPGSFVHLRAPLLWIDGPEPSEQQAVALREAFSCDNERTFDQDPRFGLIVLSEIASRALSPAVNDPGTAISVVGRLVRLLSNWKLASPEVAHPRVYVPPVQCADMVEDAFRPIVRDGAGLIEVQIRLQKGLLALSAHAPELFEQPTRQMSRLSMERAEAAGLRPEDLAALRAAGPLNDRDA